MNLYLVYFVVVICHVGLAFSRAASQPEGLSRTKPSQQATALDLSNSDLGLDMLPLAENLVWNQQQNSSLESQERLNNITLPHIGDKHTNTTLEGHNNATGTSDNTQPSGTQARPPQMTGCRTQGQIAVTYSEGPSDATAKIVKVLNNADARANFFFNASWLYTQQYAMVVQNIYQAGHFVGMTYRVKNDNSSFWTDDEIRNDILSHARTIETLIQVSPKYVRLHYTPEPDLRVEAILHDLGFVLVGYNLDSQDYSHKDPTGENSIQEVYRRSFFHQKDTYDAKGSFISIQYDIPDTGALVAVPFMIDAINDGGYTMVRLDGCLNDPTPYKKSADSKEYVSDHFSFNATDYHQGQKAIAPEALIVETVDEDRMFAKKKNSAATLRFGSPSLPVKWLIRLASQEYRPNHSTAWNEGVTCENRPQFSGQFSLPETNDHYFYLFYPAHNNTNKGSTILWLNGGPGCSSMMGALAGIGPCLITPDGNATQPNPNTWNENYSLLFLDQVKEIQQPIGTGLSYGDSKPATSSEAVQQVYLFLQNFFLFKKEYIPKSLIIAGESYAGKYLPALSDEIIRQNKRIQKGRREGIYLPLKSIIIGNGWTDPKTQLANYHTFGCEKDNEYKPLFDDNTCEQMETSSSRCQSLMDSCYKNKWACIPAGLYCKHTLLDPQDRTDPMDIRLCPHEKYQYAIERSLEIYANNHDVRQSLGVDDQTPLFENCKSDVDRRFLLSMDPLVDYSPSIARALHQNISVLIYAGDMDWICNWRGNKAWTLTLDWKGKEGFNAAKDEEVSTDGSDKSTGQMRSFGNLTFLRIYDAGHSAISDQPVVTKDLILKKWLHSFS